MTLHDAFTHTRKRRRIAEPRKEFLDQLGRLECELFGCAKPTLTGEEVYAGRHMLNLDDTVPANVDGAEKENEKDEGAVPPPKAKGKGAKGKGKGAAPPPPPQNNRQEFLEEARQRDREKGERDKEELRRKVQSAREDPTASMAYWQALEPCDIQSALPWKTMRNMKSMDGSSGHGGVHFVELDSGVVCLKPQVHTGVQQLIAGSLAQALGVRVAKSRAVKRSDAEWSEITDAISQRWALETPEIKNIIDALGIEKFYQSFWSIHGITEFVKGIPLTGLEGREVLASGPPTLFLRLGRLCALDALMNNMDRLPLPIWDNPGNLTNVIVAAGGCDVVGIDHQVVAIRDERGLQRYFARLRRLASGQAQSTAQVATRLEATFAAEMGLAKLPESSAALVLRGLLEGLEAVACLWEDGSLLRCLEEVEVVARERFAESTDCGFVELMDTTNFVRRCAAEIWAARRGLPLASVVA